MSEQISRAYHGINPSHISLHALVRPRRPKPMC